mmetsp:Transcript_14550/g.42971  ORF Transcript_14550/g.42971 Transcript_14550/m.42971 type:complete len:273 (+) Transcript_14550:1440-2258(+)
MASRSSWTTPWGASSRLWRRGSRPRPLASSPGGGTTRLKRLSRRSRPWDAGTESRPNSGGNARPPRGWPPSAGPSSPGAALPSSGPSCTRTPPPASPLLLVATWHVGGSCEKEPPWPSWPHGGGASPTPGPFSASARPPSRSSALSAGSKPRTTPGPSRKPRRKSRRTGPWRSRSRSARPWRGRWCRSSPRAGAPPWQSSVPRSSRQRGRSGGSAYATPGLSASSAWSARHWPTASVWSSHSWLASGSSMTALRCSKPRSGPSSSSSSSPLC